MEYQFRPLDRWPYKPTSVRRSRYTFRASWTDTLNLLDAELNRHRAQHVVFQVQATHSDIRRDGMLRANAKVVAPGVILSFDSRPVGPLSFPCDSCELWQHNFRSIGLALRALRDVDRYGVTRQAEQYKGWTRLPSPNGDGALWQIPRNRQEAEHLFRSLAELGPADPMDTKKLSRSLQARFHPDGPNGGDGRMFRAINEASQLLNA